MVEAATQLRHYSQSHREGIFDGAICRATVNDDDVVDERPIDERYCRFEAPEFVQGWKDKGNGRPLSPSWLSIPR